MTFFDIQTYAVIKILLIFFVVISIYFVYKKTNPVFFLVFAGGISAITYALFVNNLDLLFWGLQGDELTITAMYNTFAKVGLFSDFAYHSFSPFYPPAFFWIFGFIGRIMNWNGVLIAKSASFVFFLFFPVSLYYFQKFFVLKKMFNKKLVGNVFFILSPLIIITVLDKDLLIGKPYEVITAAMTVFWYIGLHLEITQGNWNKKKVVVYGLIAGIIFMMYYLWIIFAGLAFILAILMERKGLRKKYFLCLFQTAFVAIIVSLPFLLPLIISYLKTGMESWQTSFFIPNGLNLWLPMFKIYSINNLIFLFGFLVLIYYRNNIFIRQLLCIFLITFIWWFIGMGSLFFFKIPLQEFRGFYILAPTILAISASYGIERLWNYYKVVQNKNLYYTVTISAIIFFVSQSFFGFFIDDPLIKNRLIESRNVQTEIKDLVNFLEKIPAVSSKLTLQTAPQIMAWVPINNLIYFNQHNNHPAAIFSKRYEYVLSLASSKSSEELYKKVINCPFGQLEQFIFHSDEKSYYLYFHLDKMISGIEEKEIVIKKELFLPKYFDKVYDNNGYVVINFKNN
ncbi:MAG: arabinofuranosyltransferase [Patescibacteria group bacterium]